MSGTPRAALYSPELLALAVELANYPYDPTAPSQGEAHSRSCGSTIRLSASDDTLGLQVTACAVGQASAAIFARHFASADTASIAPAKVQIEAWLTGTGEQPDWPDIQMLAPALPYPGRHGAILLPWRAALDALSKGGAGR
ncbi:iron-sulfur cluster assembly scaffold protein [Qipengyuania aurantiaca]|uniref:Iron-sulfur cluster assembly scaffold protein n=1 Tax=Qipengyuania aurantiaca TaxID=2867233 RepID=A0ABX8ZKN6_9SPHN|nr:iron-sulfur cluster assembly scaffold protein [Qipengyuania aurantiaca]QZD89565.1 iron-sulfur cluster assembly scaffold protein [Qipengyuania aurantiaca]